MGTCLLLHDLEDEVVRALVRRAAANGRSLEDEHRAILRRALCPPRRVHLEAVVAHLPSQADSGELYIRGR